MRRSCVTCHKTYASPQSLWNHKQRCKERLSTAHHHSHRNNNMHDRNHVTDERILEKKIQKQSDGAWQCYFCPFAFSSMHELIRHQRRRHEAAKVDDGQVISPHYYAYIHVHALRRSSSSNYIVCVCVCVCVCMFCRCL